MTLAACTNSSSLIDNTCPRIILAKPAQLITEVIKIINKNRWVLVNLGLKIPDSATNK